MSVARNSEETMNANVWRVGTWLTVLQIPLFSVTIAAAPDLRLVTAAQEQNKDAVRTLLAAGVDVDTARPDGATPLL